MIYLATPYSHSDPNVREQRFKIAAIIAGKLMSKGLIVFSPIAHTHPIAIFCNLPLDFDYWMKFDYDFIDKCDKVIVAKLDGWETSKGVQAEIAIAKRLGKPVLFIDEEGNYVQ